MKLFSNGTVAASDVFLQAKTGDFLVTTSYEPHRNTFRYLQVQNVPKHRLVLYMEDKPAESFTAETNPVALWGFGQIESSPHRQAYALLMEMVKASIKGFA